MGRFRFLALLSLLFVGSCDTDDAVYYPEGDGTLPTAAYSIESEPSLSADGDYIYYVARDTLFPEKDGIYRAQVTAPRREQLLWGLGFHSPSESFDGNSVAFLTGSTVNYLNLQSGAVSSAGIPLNYASIVFVNDSIFIGCAGQLLYLINRKDSSTTQFGSGADPTFYNTEQFICLGNPGAGMYTVLRYTLRRGESSFEPLVDTLDTLTSDGMIRWLSMERSNNRYVYIEQLGVENRVYTGQVGSAVKNFIAVTDRYKACMLGYNSLIYPGPDGRFYQSNFDGSTRVPFWHAE